MCGSKQNPWLCGLGMLLAVLVVYGGRAQADITSDRSGSVIIFPKVIADGTTSTNTIIQVANTSNGPVQAHCFYIDDNCFERDFDIFLTKQQPTVWDAATGRQILDSLGDGFSPGAPLPVVQPFIGQLICIETDANGTPVAGNHLKGEAIIVSDNPGGISEYNAISVTASAAGSDVLSLDDTNYNACPEHLVMNHYAEGAVDGFTGGVASTELTLIPCTALLEDQLEIPAVAHFQVTDEMEFQLTGSVQVGCFLNLPLADLPSQFGVLPGRTLLKTRITPASGNVCYTGRFAGRSCTDNDDCPGAEGVCTNNVADRCTVDADCGVGGTCQLLGCNQYPGLLGVAEEFQTRRENSTTGPAGRAAVNLFIEGSRPGDFIVVPPLE